jgi:hypothetical protein
VFEFLQLEIGRYEINSWEIGMPNDFAKWALRVVIAKSAKERFVFLNIEFWLESEERRKARLRIKVDCENSITSQGEALREMDRTGRFRRTTLEVANRYYLEMFGTLPMR